MNAWYFYGADGISAVTLDETGANLPVAWGPWDPFKNVNIPEDEESRPVREGLEKLGYHIFPRDAGAD